MIRLAQYRDVSALVSLFQEALSRSRYKASLDRISARKVVVDCIAAHDQGLCSVVLLVSERDDKIDGFFVGTLTRLFEVTDIYHAQNLLWYVTPGSSAAWALLKGFENWLADVDGEVVIDLGISDAVLKDPQALGRALARKGYRVSGTILEKELQNGS